MASQMPSSALLSKSGRSALTLLMKARKRSMLRALLFLLDARLCLAAFSCCASSSVTMSTWRRSVCTRVSNAPKLQSTKSRSMARVHERMCMSATKSRIRARRAVLTSMGTMRKTGALCPPSKVMQSRTKCSVIVVGCISA
nr:MAG: hypothetical protein [Molluscum contagiosum virus]